jgi:hypothetical protein
MKNKIQAFDLLLVLFVLVIVFMSALSFKRINGLIKASDWVSKSDLIKLKLEQTLSYVKDAESCQRGFLLTRDSSFLQVYYATFPKVEGLLHDLDSMTLDNTSENYKIAELKRLIDMKNRHVTKLIHVSKSIEINKTDLIKGKFLMDRIRLKSKAIMDEEDRLLTARTAEKDRYVSITPLFSLMLIVFTLFVIIISFNRIRKDKLEVQARNEELLQVKTYMQAILDSSSDSIVTFDKQLNYTSLNKVAEKLINRSREELIGKNPFVLFPQALNSERHQMMQRALLGETSQIDGIPSVVNPEIQIQTLFVPLIVHGEIMGVLNIAKDITSLVKANETIVNTNRLVEAKNIELENANKELLSFNYVASHDLKEPLRKIQTFGKMLLELENKSLSETGKNYLNRMIAAALRMQTLIDALIDFSKVTANEVVYGPTSLQNTITDIGEEFAEELLNNKGRIFSRDLPEINAVQTLVYQLFFNLIGNSIKYAKKAGDLTIIVTAELVQDVFIKSKLHQGSFWKIIVIDNGIGFDPQYSEKIFDLFQRLHGNLAGFEGSGIGLTICKKIVQNHKGYIYADSALNVGSTFTVLIPTDL